jgi:hypothetical protein
MQQIGAGRLPGRLRHQGPVQVDPGLALGLLWIVAVLVVDNSSHAHVALIPAALHSTAGRWLVVAGAIAVAVVGAIHPTARAPPHPQRRVTRVKTMACTGPGAMACQRGAAG